jgi:HEPN domain-containing protein
MGEFCMSNTEAVKQWTDKALNDYRAIEILNKDVEPPIDAICFHCQQYIEKLLKAIITRFGQEVPKTHDIRKLAEMVDKDVPELTGQIDLADRLTIYGVETRYPARFVVITREKADQAIEIAEEVGNLLLKYLDRTN